MCWRVLVCVLSWSLASVAWSDDAPSGPPPSWSRYWYPVEVVRVVDGDTVDVRVDLGLEAFRLERIRLYGVNTPEPYGETRAAGLAAAEWLRDRLDCVEVLLETRRDDVDKYGRRLGTFWAVQPDGSAVNLNRGLIEAGHAAPYFGGRR